MDIKTAIDVLKDFGSKLRNSDSEYDRIVVEAIDAIAENSSRVNGVEALFICDRQKCKTCSFPECRYTTDISHAESFMINEIGMYKEVEIWHKRKKHLEISKEVMFTNENTQS